MRLAHRLLRELGATMTRLFFTDKGQGIVEYTLLIGFVALVIWAVIANTAIVQTVKGIWGGVDDQMPGGKQSLSGKSAGSGGGSAASAGTGGSGSGSASRNQNAGNADSQYSSATSQTAQEGTVEKNIGESGSAAEKPALAGSKRGLSGIADMSESQWYNVSMGLGVVLFAIIASVIPLIVWMRIKGVAKSEISFQGLQADQIVAKIKEST